MIHRAVLGSLERFFGVLIEHYAGDFPLWLSPIQARLLPVTDSQVKKKLLLYSTRFHHGILLYILDIATGSNKSCVEMMLLRASFYRFSSPMN